MSEHLDSPPPLPGSPMDVDVASEIGKPGLNSEDALQKELLEGKLQELKNALHDVKKQPGRKRGSGIEPRKTAEEYSQNVNTVRSMKRIKNMSEAALAIERAKKADAQWVRRRLKEWKMSKEYLNLPDDLKQVALEDKKELFHGSRQRDFSYTETVVRDELAHEREEVETALRQKDAEQVNRLRAQGYDMEKDKKGLLWDWDENAVGSESQDFDVVPVGDIRAEVSELVSSFVGLNLLSNIQHEDLRTVTARRELIRQATSSDSHAYKAYKIDLFRRVRQFQRKEELLANLSEVYEGIKRGDESAMANFGTLFRLAARNFKWIGPAIRAGKRINPFRFLSSSDKALLRFAWAIDEKNIWQDLPGHPDWWPTVEDDGTEADNKTKLWYMINGFDVRSDLVADYLKAAEVLGGDVPVKGCWEMMIEPARDEIIWNQFFKTY